jgi:Putative transposase
VVVRQVPWEPGLERLCRYGLRPSFALERLSLLDDGRVRYRLKRPWPRPGGVTELVLDPVDFLARLTALIPAPRVNMCRYHGVFAPASPLRGLVLPRQLIPQPAAERNTHIVDGEHEHAEAALTKVRACKHGASASKQAWAALLKRVYKVDLLRCPRCHGKMQIIAALSEPSVVARVLAHLDLPTTLPQPAPARAPPWSEEDLDQGAFELDGELDQRVL